MERQQSTAEAGWFPLRGSYEEAVLSWYEQVELSFRRRALESQRIALDARVRTGEAKELPTVSD